MADPVTVSAAVGWGISAVGWVVSPIITNLINKGFSYLDLGSRGRSAKRNELENKVSELRRVLEAVEESSVRDRLEPLLERLKSAFYEAEDILDDVEYYHLERQILFQPDDKFRRNWMKKFQSALPECSCLKKQVPSIVQLCEL